VEDVIDGVELLFALLGVVITSTHDEYALRDIPDLRRKSRDVIRSVR
jgi:hypothetical protein